LVWEPRTYRQAVEASGLIPFEVVVGETDLQVLADRDLRRETREIVLEVRNDLEAYVASHPRFAESFVPVPIESHAPEIVRAMAAAASAAGVGPMASVAGAVAQAVALGLSQLSHEVIVENGGDLFLVGSQDRVVALWAGEDGARGLGLEVPGRLQPIAVATSSGTIGPSVSLGCADTATVVAASGALADAAASVLGNRIRSAADIDTALAAVREVPGVLGAVASVGGAMGAWGEIRLVPTAPLK